VAYPRLVELLQAEQWQEADEETFNIMLKVSNEEEDSVLFSDTVENFPCDVLGTLDQLWVDASGGKFGFSVQRQIYVEGCGGIPDGQWIPDGQYGKAWECFGDNVGWRVNGSWIRYSHVIFDMTAPVGHLPFLPIFRASSSPRGTPTPGCFGACGLYNFLSKLVNCSR
jgi:hypothetical protein